MKIHSVRIEHFRCFEDETINFGDYTCFVGANGSGKSTVLNALNVFFRERGVSTNLQTLSEEDFFKRDTTKPIKITVRFGDLSKEVEEDLKGYVRQGQLVVTAVAKWDGEEQSADVTQYGSRLGMKAFAPFFEALGNNIKVADLRSIYGFLREKESGLPNASTKDAMTEALREFEGKHPEKCELIESSDTFYGVSKGEHKLGKHIQWVFIPAVKDATTEQVEAKDTALGKLVARAVRANVQFAEQIKAIEESAHKEYDKLLTANQAHLDALSASLKRRLCEWAHPSAELSVKWDKDPKKAVQIEEPFAKIKAGDKRFVGDLGRMGHGLQRSYMFALLHELAGNDEAGAPRLLLGIEEPELFQHPPQAQHLADVLAKLSAQNAQVLACSHSPYFVTGKGFEDVRLVRADEKGGAHACELTFAELAAYLTRTLGDDRFKKPEGLRAKLNQALQPALREMFFAPKLVLVEGLEDVAFIACGLELLGLRETWRAAGCHIVPVEGKSSLVQPVAIATLLNIPFFAIFDADLDQSVDKDGKPSKYESAHKADNERLLKLLGGDVKIPFPPAMIIEDRYAVWSTNFGDSVRADYTLADWTKWKSATEAELGQPGGLEKNSMCIAGILEKAWLEGKPSQCLTKVCNALMAFAKA
jgi:putative ATP-dependent endonuclease of OLD family